MELLQLSIPNNKLVFDSIYLNGLHALHRFTLTNTSDFVILVKFKSNLGSQIAFQLSNENLLENDLDEYLVTNTVIAAFNSQKNKKNISGNLFNQLFNYVNHVDSVTIQPKSSINLIISFLPELNRKKEELLDFFEINGLLFFFAYKMQDITQESSPDYQVFKYY